MKISVEHIGLPARNAATLRDWYVAKLGAECIAPSGDEPPFFLRPPGSAAMFEIYQATGSNPITEDNGLAGWRHSPCERIPWKRGGRTYGIARRDVHRTG